MTNRAKIEEAIQLLDNAIFCVTGIDFDPQVEYQIYTKIEDAISQLEVALNELEA